MHTLQPERSRALEAVLYRGQSALYVILLGVLKDALAGDIGWTGVVSALIREHTGILMDVVVDDAHPTYYAQIYWKPFDVNHVFRQEEYKRYPDPKVTYNLAPYRILLGDGQGWLEDTGRVRGAFAKIPVELWIGKKMLDGTFTVEELAAVILHEIGHVYTYFETMGRTVATALAIADAESILASSDDVKTREHAIAVVGKYLHFPDDFDAATLAEPGQESTFQAVAIRNAVVAGLHGDTGDHRLFNGESEFLADSYAVRMGAAQPLVSANVKLAKFHYDPHAVGRLEFMTTSALKMGFFVAAFLFPPAGALATLYGAYALISQRSASTQRNTPVERLEAVHGDLVAISKDRRLPKAILEQVIQDFNFVAGLREQLTENLTISMVIWSTLVPSHRRAYQQVQLERQIQKLVNNDIYMQAAKLKHMAS